MESLDINRVHKGIAMKEFAAEGCMGSYPMIGDLKNLCRSATAPKTLKR